MFTEKKPSIEVVNFLAHYGVVGMKRGVRKLEELNARDERDAVKPESSGKRGWSDAARIAALATRLKNLLGLRLSDLDGLQGSDSFGPKLPWSDEEVFNKGTSQMNMSLAQRTIYKQRMVARLKKNPNDEMANDYLNN
jgi:hypothetical protein